LAVVLFATLGVTLSRAAPPELPALMAPATSEHHVGKVIFAQLVTPDLAAAKAFYAKLFGWTFRDIQFDDIPYAEAYFEGRPVAGMVEKPIKQDEHRQPAWLNFISAGDVDVTARDALQRGGKILVQPREVGGLGRAAVLADPQGAVFAVLASSSGDPPDILAEPGSWIWSSLITTDPDTDSAFYQDLFGYEVFELSTGNGPQHLLLSTENFARVSVNTQPADSIRDHPYWLNFVRVQDATTMSAKVVTLGGRVLVQPRPDRQGGKIAVVADPFGAPFGLLEWPGDASKEVRK
jgi:predicted enzyme related to lactoylglutathione lyase